MKRRKPLTIDEYLASLPADKRATLSILRARIRAAVPDGEECISYGIPAMRWSGRVLVFFHAATHHCSFFPGAFPIASHAKALTGLDTSKGTVRFPVGKPLSAALVKSLVTARMTEMALKHPTKERIAKASPEPGARSSAAGPTTSPIGYSGTPLAKKLGIAAGSRVRPLHAPRDYTRLLAPLPEGVLFERKVSARTDIVHLFCDRKATLTKELAALRRTIRRDGTVWVSWPKKSAKVPTDISEDSIRAIALPLGFVDVKVCAVSDVWSGLKLVVRKELR